MISLSSRIFRGTFYEFQVKEALTRHLKLKDLTRVGGAGDNGIDIFGKWQLSQLKGHGSLSSKRPELHVLIQCKNYASKIKPLTIRELAGAHDFHTNCHVSNLSPIVMFLVSPSPLTKLALAQMDTSSVPLVHVRLSPMKREVSGIENEDYLIKNWSAYFLGPIYMNEAAQAVLQDCSVEKELRLMNGTATNR